MTNNHQLQKEFVSLYEAESDTVFRYCFFRTSDRELALDLTQEAFMRLWNSLQKGTRLGNSRAFLFTVARNLVIDWYRKKKSLSLESLYEETETELTLPSDEYAFETITMEAESRFLLRKVSKLPEPYREVVWLRFVEGLPPKEIAKLLKESVNVVSVRITRGIEKLRQLTGYTKESRKEGFAEKIYRFMVGEEEVYEVAKRRLKEQKEAPKRLDTEWFSEKKVHVPGGALFLKEHGVKRYRESGLLEWHASLVNSVVSVVIAGRPREVFYEDKYQAICKPEIVEEIQRLSLEEFLRERGKA